MNRHHLDPDAVARDDQLVEDLRRGGHPTGRAGGYLAAWRDHTRADTDTPIFDQLADERLLDMTAPDRPDKTLTPAEQGHEPALAMLPEPTPARTFDQDDGSTYARVPAGDLPSGDDIDSTSIDDDGAPA